MKHSLWLAALALFLPTAAIAQGQPSARVVTTCGSPSVFPTNGQAGPLTVNTSGQLCSSEIISSSNTEAPITPATATATKSSLLGMQYNSTQATFTNGQQGAVQGTARGALYVATGADAFVVNSNASSAARTARGTTITLGGTSQTLMAANASRKGFTIQNPCSLTTQGIAAAESLFVNFTSAATVNTSANVAEIAPCSSYSEGLNGGAVSQEVITVIGATTGHIVYAKEF